jgi:outer membrane receptor protein involved in Fe transport
LTDAVSLFAGFRDAFRVPSQGQLFRPGSTRDTVNLKPVRAQNLEAGVRANRGRLTVQASVYRLDMRDDILSYRDPADGLTYVVNAGQTLHRGVEFGGDLQTVRWLRLSANYAYAQHTYEDWVLDPRQVVGVDYSGKQMETAPSHMGNLMLMFLPGRRASGSIETAFLGSYWMDAANTQTYDGHTLVNVRAQVRVNQHLTIFGRVLNLTDQRYAESSSYTLARGREFAPGMPLTGYVGLSVLWQR